MADIGIDLTDFLPPPPAKDATLADINRWANELLSGMTEYAEQMRTRATLYNRVSDGSNTQRAYDANGVLTLSGTGDTTVTVAETGGVVINSTGGGGTIDFDLPLMKDITFSYDGANNRVTWTAGTIDFGGTTYNIPAGDSGSGSTSSDVTVTWKEGDSILQSHTGAASAQPGLWYLAFYNQGDTDVKHALQSTIIHGGLIQASTVTATEIDVDNLFAQDISLTGAIHSPAKTGYSDSDQGFWLGMDSGTAKLNLGDASEYLKWSGADLTVACSAAFIGDSSGSYLDFNSTVHSYPALRLDNGTSGSFYAAPNNVSYKYAGGTSWLIMETHSNVSAQHYPEIQLRRSRGADINTEAVTNTGDWLGSINFMGYSSTHDAGARLYAYQSGSSPTAGTILYVTATDYVHISDGSGDGKLRAELHQCRVGTSAKATPEEGDLKLDSANHNVQCYLGSAWRVLNNNAVSANTQIKIGSFTRSASNPQAITGVGFQPDAVILIPHDAYQVLIRTDQMTTTYSKNATDGNWVDNGITSLDSDGFTINSYQASPSGNTISYIAWKSL